MDTCRRGRQVVLFESWLRHEVAPHPAAAERVSVSFNYSWFRIHCAQCADNYAGDSIRDPCAQCDGKPCRREYSKVAAPHC